MQIDLQDLDDHVFRDTKGKKRAPYKEEESYLNPSNLSYDDSKYFDEHATEKRRNDSKNSSGICKTVRITANDININDSILI